MNIDGIFRIAAIGILLAVLDQVLRRAGREDVATLVSLAGLVVVLYMIVNMVNGLFQNVKNVLQLY